MSQGLFSVEHTTSGDRQVSRAAASEQMLDAAGRSVREDPLSMSLTELKAKIARALAVPVPAGTQRTLISGAGK
jgi:hypothetical protein